MHHCGVGWKKCENANRVDSFIWHPRVIEFLKMYLYFSVSINSNEIGLQLQKCKNVESFRGQNNLEIDLRHLIRKQKII